jgi:hypothetical protein
MLLLTFPCELLASVPFDGTGASRDNTEGIPSQMSMPPVAFVLRPSSSLQSRSNYGELYLN